MILMYKVTFFTSSSTLRQTEDNTVYNYLKFTFCYGEEIDDERKLFLSVKSILLDYSC